VKEALRPSAFGRLVIGALLFFAFLGVTGVSDFAWSTDNALIVALVTLICWGVECGLERDGKALVRLRGWLIWPAFAVLSESSLQLIVRYTPDVMDAALADWDAMFFLKHVDVALEAVRGPLLTPLWEVAYQSMFFTPLVLWLVARNDPAARQAFLRAFLIIAAVGAIGYMLVPAVGPRFYYPEWYSTDLYGAPLEEAVAAERNATAAEARAAEAYPPFFHRNCFPSLHTAWGVLYLLMALRLGRVWLLLAAPFALGQIGATVVLRWHYVIDIFFGILLAFLAWRAAGRLAGRTILRERAPPTASYPAGRVLTSVFALSGAAALLYELAAARSLATVFGGMADAVATVLATYMLGLSVGAWIGGKIADRIQAPIKAYAIAEGLIAVAVLLLPFGRDLVLDIYVSAIRAGAGPGAATALRVTLSAALLLPPTLAMGATLPLLVAAWMRTDPQAGRAIPRLYGANTLGAALGVLLGTYLILPAMGISKTLLLVACADVIAALLALQLSKQSAAAVESAPAEIAPPQAPSALLRPTALLAAVFLGSFALFSLEVQWTHLLAVVVGNSAYAFGVMLFSVLVGLALGGRSAEHVPTERHAAVLGRDAVLFSAAIAVSLLLWDRIPSIFHMAGRSAVTFSARETIRFLVCLCMLFPPCFLSGRIYALALSIYTGGPDGAGARVGRLSAASTVGAVAGSLLGSFWILPTFGSETSLRVLATILLVCAGLYVLAVSASRATRLRTGVGAALCVVLLAALPGWSFDRLANGANVYFRVRWEGPTVFAHEDKFGGLTTVKDRHGELLLLTNGKFQGNNSSEMADQQAFAMFPILHASTFDRALVIGLGTGVSAATVKRFPYKAVEVAEISPGIIEAADRFYADINDDIVNVLGDDLHQQDGRHHLLITDNQYDLVSMEISSIWFSGASALYNREFYNLVQQRMAPGGVFQQWVQLHHIYSLDLASVFASIRAAFPHVLLYVGGHQGILVASDDPLVADPDKLRRWCADPAFARGCATAPDGDLPALLKSRLLDSDGLDRFVEDVAAKHGFLPEELISTDDSLYLEYATPRGNVLPDESGAVMRRRLGEYR